MDPPALQPVEDLRRAVAVLAASDDAAARRVAAGLAEYLARAKFGLPLETCLGLARMPGQSGWWALEAIEARNAAIRNLAATFFPDKRPSQAAYEIHRMAGRYAASAWRFDQGRADMPENYRNTVHEHLWQAFKADQDMPIAKRTIERILAAERRIPNMALSHI